MPNTPRECIINKPRYAPCYQCEDRVVGCHAKCEKYKVYQAILKKEKTAIQKAYKSERRTEDYVVKEKIKRAVRRSKKYNKYR